MKTILIVLVNNKNTVIVAFQISVVSLSSYSSVSKLYLSDKVGWDEVDIRQYLRVQVIPKKSPMIYHYCSDIIKPSNPE